jgi:PiT family inorganic phosphate transporter
MSPVTTLLVLTVVAAAVFAWSNGVHDAANAIATSLSTGALTPRFGLAMAAVLNGLGALVGIEVALTVSDRLVDVPQGRAGVVVVLAALLAAIGWNALTWWAGLPSSSSHALIAGLVGAGLVAGAGVDARGVVEDVVVPTVLSPVVGLLAAWLLVLGCGAVLRGVNRRLTLRRLRMAQSVSAAAVALGHGLQDGQKTMGAVVLALTAAGQQDDGSVPLWVRLMAAGALAAGTAAGGWRLIRTLGRRVAPLDALGGFAAQASSAVVLYLAAAVGAPISSTQTVTASVAGAGAAAGIRVVRWGLFRRILLTWVLTPVVCGAAAALVQAAAG